MTAQEDEAGSPWLVVHAARDAQGPRMRLFCFHYAGATASIFRTWQASLPGWLEVVAVQLPGRDYRFGEPLLEDAGPIAAELADHVQPLLDRPFAFFGHSMGALIAFDLAHELRRRGLRQPELFIASGRNAPRFLWRDAGIQALSDEVFIATVRDYNGTPEALLAEPSMRDLWLPRLRADLTISATYRYAQPAALDCPILVLHGTNDGLISDEGLRGWLAETRGPVRYVCYPGNHFFLHSDEPIVLANLSRELEKILAGAGGTATGGQLAGSPVPVGHVSEQLIEALANEH